MTSLLLTYSFCGFISCGFAGIYLFHSKFKICADGTVEHPNAMNEVDYQNCPRIGDAVRYDYSSPTDILLIVEDVQSDEKQPIIQNQK